MKRFTLLVCLSILLSVSAFAQSVGGIFFETSYTRSQGTAATPTFNPVAGTYSGTQSVTISSSTAGSTLCYTTDGSDPAASTPGTCSAGSTYSSPVSVASSLTLKALATKAAYINSVVGSAAYTINAGSLPFTDSFAGTGSLSPSWSVWQATAGTPVRANGFSANAWGTAAVKLVGVSMPNDQWAEVQVNSLATSQLATVLTRLTATDSTNFTGYAMSIKPDGATINIGKCTNSFSCSFLVACGTVTAGHTYRLTATGTTLTVKDNGVQACTVTDSTYASGTVGLQVACSGTCPAVVNFQAD